MTNDQLDQVNEQVLIVLALLVHKYKNVQVLIVSKRAGTPCTGFTSTQVQKRTPAARAYPKKRRSSRRPYVLATQVNKREYKY